VQQRAADFGMYQEILRTPCHFFNALARQRLAQHVGNRPAQARLADVERDHGAADQMRGQSASRGFDFG